MEFFFGNEKNSPSILLEKCSKDINQVIEEKLFSNVGIAFSNYQIIEGMKYIH